MTSGGLGSSRRDVVRLFEGGSVAGLGDGQLLERFAIGRDEAAFEALVSKLGPMVLGVCRRILADPHDVDDAFQATFLVLVRRAGSIRDRDLVAPWLHGVATKVAKRARAESSRRAVRERVAVVEEGRAESVEDGSDWSELRALIDEEIDRLPENHRRPVILCDVEGLSREEAARQLGWSLNMVRGRLERARDRLRGRLARRGLAPTSGAWLALVGSPPHLSPVLLNATCRAAVSFGVGRLGVGLASASAVALSRGVLKMMLLSKLKFGLVALISTGFVATGTGMLVAQGPGQKADPANPATVPVPSPTPVAQAPAKSSGPFQPRARAELARERVAAARQRLEAQKAFYEEGRITIDRLIDASEKLMQAELNVSESKAQRVEAVQVHYRRIAEILKREQAALEVGRATQADVAEVKGSLLDAEFTLARELEAPETKPTETAPKAGPNPPVAADAFNATVLAKLAAERVEIARRISENTVNLYRNARIDLLDCLNAEKALMEAEEAAATTKAGRIEAIQSQIKTLKNLLAVAQARVEAARAMHIEVDRIRLKILDTEAHLIEVSNGPEAIGGGSAPAPTRLVPLIVSPALARRVEIARRVSEDTLKLYQSAQGQLLDCLITQKALLEAEEAAATTKAGRVEAIQGHIRTLEKLLVTAEEMVLGEVVVEGHKATHFEVDRVRLAIAEAEAHLTEVSETPDKK